MRYWSTVFARSIGVQRAFREVSPVGRSCAWLILPLGVGQGQYSSNRRRNSLRGGPRDGQTKACSAPVNVSSSHNCRLGPKCGYAAAQHAVNWGDSCFEFYHLKQIITNSSAAEWRLMTSIYVYSVICVFLCLSYSRPEWDKKLSYRWQTARRV